MVGSCCYGAGFIANVCDGLDRSGAFNGNSRCIFRACVSGVGAIGGVVNRSTCGRTADSHILGFSVGTGGGTEDRSFDIVLRRIVNHELIVLGKLVCSSIVFLKVTFDNNFCRQFDIIY